MLIRTDPFRQIDPLSQQLVGTEATVGTRARPVMMPMDAWQDADSVHVELDVPIAEESKPRRIAIGDHSADRRAVTI